MSDTRPIPALTAARALRLALRLTQDEVARRAGISRHSLSVAERSPDLMTARLAERLARALGVDPSQLTPRICG